MTKYIIAVSVFWLAIAANTAFANGNKQAQECLKESESFSNTSAKNEFLGGCLKKIDRVSFQREEKVEQCDQNAKNLKVAGDKKDVYLRHCYFEDDAHPNPNQTPHPKL